MTAQLEKLPAARIKTGAALKQVYLNPSLIEMLENSRVLRLKLKFFYCF